jgi:hypothetical protein
VALWVPKMLTARQTCHRCVETNWALIINRDPDEFLKTFFMVNETCVNHYDPESKRRSIE